ncbi:autotransporter outer membrane beta-barrel domain-containing protein [Reyranella sp.]|uniref:autotransporter outer membrane beta-barrel domain-containing protein n=1 Tax=Reyranella sp. TaxID=1929291 RepID=UPI003BAA0917
MPTIAVTGGNGGNGGHSTGGGGGGGAGGYGAVVTGSGLTGTIGENLAGGSGGNGGNSGGTAAKGSGGSGGSGLRLTGSSNEVTLGGTVRGGNGGTLGTGGGVNVPAGNGGTGVVSGSGNTLIISGSVSGGTGGDQATSGTAGFAGSGGIGITASGSRIVVTSTGSVAGGLAGNGGPQANAIQFLGGTNTLEIHRTDGISGTVLAGGSSDTLSLGGTASQTFDVSQIGATAQYRDFDFFAKTGTGTWTLTGDQSGTTTPWTVEQGTLAISDFLSLGSEASTLTLGGGTLSVTAAAATSRAVTLAGGGGALDTSGGNATLSGVISGGAADTLTKSGADTLTLTAANTYDGATVVAAGTLAIGNAGALGSVANGTTVLGGATLQLQGGIAVGLETLTLAGSGASNGGALRSASGDNSFAGAIALSSAARINSDAGTLTLSGNIAGAGQALTIGGAGNTVISGIIGTATGTLTKDGTGVLTLTGSNTYSGTTTISAGTLQIGAGGTTGSLGTGAVTNNGTLQVNRSDTVTLANAIGGTGSFVQAGPGTTILTGSNSYSGGTLVAAGTLQGTTASLKGNIANNAAVVFSQVGSGTYAGNMSGTGSLALQGGGSYTLSGFNSYTGGTSVAPATTVIANAASLQGSILNNGSITFNQTGPGTYAGAMAGSGSMTLQGGGALTIAGSNTYTGPTTVDASTLIVNGSLASTVTVANGGILAGSGRIGAFVSSGGIIAPGNSIGTLTINGNFVQNGGTYVVEANAQGQSDRVNVAGTATLNGANVQVLAATGTYATSTTYTILNATGGISGTYAGVSSNFAFLTPSLTYDPNNVFLTLALQGPAPFSGFGGNTPNQRAVGTALDRSWATATGDFATVIGALANLNTSQAAPALNAISGQPYADFGTTNIASAALFMNTLGQQMAMARGGAARSGATGSGQRRALAEACDVAACDGASPFSAWFSALGSLGFVQGDSNASTLTYNVGGGAAGIDYRVDPRILVGLGLGYTHGTQWVNAFMGQGWSDSVSVAAYGSFTQAGFYADALAGYAYVGNQMQRQIQVPGLQARTANGSTGANQVLGQVETGYRLGLWDAATSLTPFARFQASSTNQNGFSESGANALNLNVAQQTTNSLRTVLGASIASSLALGSERFLSLALRLGWQHEYADTARPITAAFTGAPTAAFTVYGATPTRDSAIVGFSATTSIAQATDVYLRYDGELAVGTDNHALTAGLRLSW